MKSIVKTENNKLRILVPTDFSGHALHAGAYAIQLFKNSIGEIILENIYQFPKDNTGTLISINDLILHESEEKLKNEQLLLKKTKTKFAIALQSKEGNPINVIKQSLKKTNVDLLVIGHNSKIDKFSSTFIGQPECWPTLLVPASKTIMPTKEAIIISSSVKSDLNLSPNFKEISDRFKDNSHLLYFTKNSTVEHLKATIKSLLETNKRVGMLIFNTIKGDRLEQAIKGHQLDQVFYSHPSLLISNNEG
jgi:hypothetical protein